MNESLAYGGVFLLLLLGFIFGPSPVGAHVEGGESVTVGPYVVEFASDPAVPIAGQETFLSFSVRDAETDSHLNDVRITVIIEDQRGKIFEMEDALFPSGDLLLTFTFPSDGTHSIALEIKEDSSLRRAEFEIEVSPLGVGVSNVGDDAVTLILVAGGSFVAGGVLGYLLRRRRP